MPCAGIYPEFPSWPFRDAEYTPIRLPPAAADSPASVPALDAFRSQRAEHVLEVYRTAVAEYAVPKEMLSDQGFQYASWRGATRFEAESGKDRVRHLKSRPHHPMTLGKIERFWKLIWEEFLVRAQFDSLESARERIRL